MALSENLREGIRSSFEANGGIFGQALQYRREKQEHEKAVQQEIKTINKGTLRLSSTRDTLANLETSFLAISKNMQLIAKAYEAQVTLQEETNEAMGAAQVAPQAQKIGQKQAELIQKQMQGPEAAQEPSLFERAFDLLDDLGRKTRGGGKGGKGGKPTARQNTARQRAEEAAKRKGGTKEEIKKAGDKAAEKAAKRETIKQAEKQGAKAGGKAAAKTAASKVFAKTLGKIAAKSIPIIGAGIGIAFAVERLIRGDTVGAGIEVAGGLGSVITSIPATIANTTRDVYFETYGVYPEQDPLRAERYQEIYDGVKEAAEEAIGKKLEPTPEKKPAPAMSLPPTGAGGGRGIVNPQTVAPPVQTPPANVIVSGSGEAVRSGSGEFVTSGTLAAKTEDKKPPAGGSVIDTVTAALSSFGITNPFAKSAILANIEKESGFKPRSEDLAAYAKTSNQRIRDVFTTRVAKYTDEELDRVKKDPAAFGEVVYGKETKLGAGMGNTQEGDGYKYRGRGFIQITGKNNYAFFGKMIGEDLVGNPDKANEPWVAAKIAAAFVVNGLKNKLDFSSQSEANRAVTQAIGGKSLNLDKGYGAEILAKVDKYSGKYINEASTAVASAKTGQQGGSTTVIVAAQQPDTKKAPVTQGPRKEYHTPIAA